MFYFSFGEKLLDASLVHTKKNNIMCSACYTVHRPTWRCSREDLAALRTVHSLIVTWLLFLAGLVRNIRNIQDVNTPVCRLYMVNIHIKHLEF